MSQNPPVHGINFREHIQNSIKNVTLTEAQLADFERFAKSITPKWMVEPTKPFSYNNTQELSSCPELVQVRESSTQQGYHVSVFHYLRMCHYCFEGESEGAKLRRCRKCEIVAYCGKECQTTDWKSHKIFCKAFPLRVGYDEIANYRTRKVDSQSHRRLIKDLWDRSYRMVFMTGGNEITLGMNQVMRWCNYPGCNVTDTNRLHCCRCLEASYCSQSHHEQDEDHQKICNQIYIKMNSFTRNNSTLTIPYMKAYPPSNDYRPLSGGKARIAENIISEITEAVLAEGIIPDKWTNTQVDILADRLVMPFTILYCLQKFGVGQTCSPLSEVTSLNIHITTALPLFDPQMWELFMHRLPKLKELKITFIGCAGLNWHPNNALNTMIKFKRCQDCEDKDRLVSIKVLLSHYHMFFSSEEYEEPDVVAIFGYNKKLLDNKTIEKDDVNEVTSYRNMTYNKDATVILTDHADIWLEQGIKEINAARPINVLMPVIENPLKGTGHFESMKRHGIRFNVLAYLTCVQRK